MKKILVITAFPPNNRTAGQNYTRQFINELSEKNEVSLISFSFSGHNVEVDKKVKILKLIETSVYSKMLSSIQFPTFHPFFTSRFSWSVLQYIKAVSSEYDILYFDFSQVFIYSLWFRSHTTYLMAHDVIYQRESRKKSWVSIIMLPFVLYTEKILLKCGSQVLCFSEKDKLLIRDNYDLNAAVVFFYIKKSLYSTKFKYLNKKSYFVFFGAWNRDENALGLIWFINYVLPHVNLDIEFRVLGPGLTDEVKKLISKNSTIVYSGFVEDPYQVISESSALIAPIFIGAGVKVKVLEALATGTPIIGTPIAFEGITEVKKGCFIIAEVVEEFLSAINKFSYWSSEERVELQALFFQSYGRSSFAENI